MEPAPEPIKTLLAGSDLPPTTKQFREHIRAYNSALQMASSGIHVASPRQGISMIAVTGAIHHLLGPLLANTPEEAKFAQLYIIDSHAEQLQQRIAALGQGNSALDAEVLGELQRALVGGNRYVRQFRQVMDMPEAELHDCEIVIKIDGTVDRRRYNLPTGQGADQIAGFMPGDEPGERRCIRVQARQGVGNPLSFMSDCHPAYDPLHFVLFHPRGEDGWHPNIMKQPPPARGLLCGTRGQRSLTRTRAHSSS